MADTTKTAGQEEPWFLKAKSPVSFPTHLAFTMTNEEFEAFLEKEMKEKDPGNDDADSFTMVSTPPSTAADLKEKVEALDISDKASHKPESDNKHPFMEGLIAHNRGKDSVPDMSNKMLTENNAIAHRSTTNPLVDLFSELEDVVSGPRLLELLNSAWAHDSLATLKIIFNSRSIHLGKASKNTFYRCTGWLAQYHPLTLIANLQWLNRGVIEKKVEQKNGDNDAVVLVEPKVDEGLDEATKYDVRNGMSHGYWKDLVNILALYANEKLDVLADPKEVLNIKQGKEARRMTKEEAKAKRLEIRTSRHERAVQKFKTDRVYRCLHLAITRLFVAQLKQDYAALQGDDSKAKRYISVCAKWAPSNEDFHDKHTFINSSIAEVLHPMANMKKDLLDVDPSLVGDEEKMREVYLRHARNEYRKSIAALRAHLDIVERHVTDKTYSDIKYDRVPSIAMSRYAKTFATKDPGGFGEYIDKVASGKARISGATLLPSTLIQAVRHGLYGTSAMGAPTHAKQLVEQKMAQMQRGVLDGQWKTLVQRIKDSGTLESCIAVCDVSGSMSSPVFPDKTCPMDSSIGLSLLVAEVTKPPFGGTFISFSEDPAVYEVDVTQTLSEKVKHMQIAGIGYSTNFVSVFENLILPMAVENKLKQEDMVKRVFVFSDMQFNQSEGYGGAKWKTSYERIAEMYKKHGYEMPQLVFWNLAGGRAGYGGGGGGDAVAPKPVTTDDVGTALVSGYSQGMLKVFLDNGSFDDDITAEEDEVKDEDGDEDDLVEVSVAKRQKMDPLSTVKKAIGHRAYEMLKVLD